MLRLVNYIFKKEDGDKRLSYKKIGLKWPLLNKFPMVAILRVIGIRVTGFNFGDVNLTATEETEPSVSSVS